MRVPKVRAERMATKQRSWTILGFRAAMILNIGICGYLAYSHRGIEEEKLHQQDLKQAEQLKLEGKALLE
jgi:hypothetical protein